MRRLTTLIAVATLASLLATNPAASGAEGGACDLIAWSGRLDGNNHIYVADGQGGNRVNISSATATNYLNALDPEWSPDGSRIVFSSIHDGGAIITTDPDGQNPDDITARAALDGITATQEMTPTWSADGTRIAWSGVNDRRNIYAASADGSGAATIYRETKFDRNALEPSWSTDGTRVAFQRGFELVTMPSGGGAVSTLDDVGEDAVYSPDGSRLAWQGSDPNNGGTAAIFVADANGAGAQLITSGLWIARDPEWSPDGSRLAWTTYDLMSGRTEVVHSLPDGSDRQVASGDGPTTNRNPVWSPDGTELAWRGSDFMGPNDIYAAAIDGTNLRNISAVGDNAPQANQTPDWSATEASFTFDRSVSGTRAFGETVVVELEVTSSCPATDVVVENAALTCMRQLTAETSSGDIDQAGRWLLPIVDGTETATITGVVSVRDNCSGTTSTGQGTGSLAFSAGNAIPECPSPDQPFADVAPSSFAFDDVGCIVELKVTNGTSDTTYSPGDLVTREQMASFIARMFRSLGGTCDFSPAPFDDVPATSFAVNDIACIYNLEITTGATLGVYNPAGSVTREQMAAFLARLWEALGRDCPDVETPFVDVDGGSFAAVPVACVYHLGITTGTSLDTYNPAGSVTREQMAAFLARLWRAATAPISG